MSYLRNTGQPPRFTRMGLLVSEWFVSLNPVLQAFLAASFTWFMTASGAGVVLFFNNVNRKALACMLGFAAGVMTAASFWSLLAPAIELSEMSNFPKWFPAAVGFLTGGAFLWCVDKTLPHLHPGLRIEEAEGIKTNWKKSILLVLAITLHNVPEGLAVGVAFGALGTDYSSATLGGAIALAIGIGIQNLPEGAAVAVPLRLEGLSRRKSFWYGQISGIVEPIAAIFGAAAVIWMQPLLPYALAFAAGAMIFVVVEAIVPDSQGEKDTDIATVGTMLGFTLMMILDVALG